MAKKTNRKDKYKPLAPEDPVTSQTFIDQVMDRFGIDMSDPVNQMIANWNVIAGEELAQHVRCDRYDNGVLYLVCDHPSRASYVRMNSRELMKRIVGVYPEVDLKKIVTRVRPARTT